MSGNKHNLSSLHTCSLMGIQTNISILHSSQVPFHSPALEKFQNTIYFERLTERIFQLIDSCYIIGLYHHLRKYEYVGLLSVIIKNKRDEINIIFLCQICSSDLGHLLHCQPTILRYTTTIDDNKLSSK